MVAFASFSHLVVISIDRYIAIKYPMRYQVIVTETRIITSVVLAWGFTLLVTINELALALIDSESIYSIYSQVNILIEIVIMTVFTAVVLWSNGYIYSETRRQVKRLKAEQLPQLEVQRITKDRKAAITLAIILIALVFTYLPAITTGVLATLQVSTVVPPRLSVIIWSWVAISIMLGSLVNPIIYCWRMKNLRRAFLEILHLRKPENTMPETEIQGTQRNQAGPRGNLAFSLPENGQPVLLSFRQLQVEYIPRIDEANEN